MKRSLQVFVCFIAFLLLPISAVWAAEIAPCWRLDAPAEMGVPRSFRTSSDAFSGGEMVTREGLDWLRMSGSGQPSEVGLSALYEHIRELTMAPVYLVDLRQESHGFVGGNGVSWYSQHNLANRGKRAAEIESIEKEQLAAMVNQPMEAVPLGQEDTASFVSVQTVVKHPTTEREAAVRLGFRYVRIAAPDQMWPDAPVVDDFMDFYKSLPAEPVWLHFHCQAGHGRTTVFMVLYDLLRNPQLPLEAIVARQTALGGSNLLAPVTGEGRTAELNRDRSAKLRLFYQYVQENSAAGYPVKWSDWLKKQAE